MIQYQILIIVGVAIALDVITGISQAAYNNCLSSVKMRNGVYHKLSYVFAIALAGLIEYASAYIELGFDLPLVIPVVIYIVLTEVISIFENICLINPELKNSPLFKLLARKEEH